MVGIPILMGRLYKYSNKKVPIYLYSDFAKNGASKYIGTFLLGCRNVMGLHQNRLADFQKSTSPR